MRAPQSQGTPRQRGTENVWRQAHTGTSPYLVLSLPIHQPHINILTNLVMARHMRSCAPIQSICVVKWILIYLTSPKYLPNNLPSPCPEITIPLNSSPADNPSQDPHSELPNVASQSSKPLEEFPSKHSLTPISQIPLPPTAWRRGCLEQ